MCSYQTHSKTAAHNRFRFFLSSTWINFCQSDRNKGNSKQFIYDIGIHSWRSTQVDSQIHYKNSHNPCKNTGRYHYFLKSRNLCPLGALIVWLTGKSFGMDSIYGTIIPFAFAQGPGQAAAFGALYEGYGWENAAVVGVASHNPCKNTGRYHYFLKSRNLCPQQYPDKQHNARIPKTHH